MTTGDANRLVGLEDRHGGSLMARRPLPPMARGAGAHLWDTDGERYLDLTSAYGVAPIGHAHPDLVRAIAEQAGRLVSCPGNLYSEVRARYLERLHRVLPSSLAHAYLCNSGAEAVEAAIKLAVLTTSRRRLVALQGSFHGRTLGALSLTWSPGAREPFAGLLQETTFVRRDRPEALDAAIDDATAAVVVEVIQGEGGVIPIDEELLLSAQRMAHERGALFVVDEIQTGFGRTGEWFAHPRVGLEPDVITLAKGIAGGLPMGAAVYNDRVAEALSPNVHASTFGANPLVCAAGLATLEVLERDDLPGRAQRLGQDATAALRAGLGQVPRVREVRGRGLMIGIELREKAGPFLARLLREHRMLALPAGPTVVRLLPPLVIAEGDLEAAVAALIEILS